MIGFISVDFQMEFTDPSGSQYRVRSSVRFVKTTLIPWFKEKGIKAAEIISDYRQPRVGDRGDCCYPGSRGYHSEIPQEVKVAPAWVKCMNDPTWVRKGIGDERVTRNQLGLPYQDPEGFNAWLEKVVMVGNQKLNFIVLFGLTLDCCVFCVAQQLNFRGYRVLILEEGTDTFSGDQPEKKRIISYPPLTNWARPIAWNILRAKFH